jgi:hypothetical protein
MNATRDSALRYGDAGCLLLLSYSLQESRYDKTHDFFGGPLGGVPKHAYRDCSQGQAREHVGLAARTAARSSEDSAGVARVTESARISWRYWLWIIET